MSPAALLAQDDVCVGFEVGTGEPVRVPIRHLAVTGQTQESGKTTALEALAVRVGQQQPVLAFITKRGESAFQTWANPVRPYFRDRADWQFVTGLIDATLREKNKFLRPWIMKICRTTRSLADVQAAVRKALAKARGIHEGVYTQIDEYLNLIVPEIRRAPLADRLEVLPGVNVMDVADRPTAMQMLFVQSAIDWVNAHEQRTVVVVPEAWEMVPEGKGSPVKASAVELVRKGAAVGNRIWVDSQDMAGVSKEILRGCPVWLIGVQREANEIKRNLANIPAGIKKPNAAQVALLRRGQFFVCWASHCIKTYVWPMWLSDAEARAVARGTRGPSQRPAREGESSVTEQEARELRQANERLTAEVQRLGEVVAAYERQVPKLFTEQPPPDVGTVELRRVPQDRVVYPQEEEFFARFRDRLVREAPALLRVLTTVPELEVQVTRETVQLDGKSWVGRVAALIAEGFFKTPRRSSVVYAEAMRRGATGVAPRADEACKKLLAMGFLTREEDGFREVPDMKVRIVERDA